MQATYDVRRSQFQTLPITFAVGVSLILGAAGGFALKGLTQPVVIAGSAPVVHAALAGPMASGSNSAQLTRIELRDQQGQAQSGSVPATGARAEANQASSRYGPR